MEAYDKLDRYMRIYEVSYQGHFLAMFASLSDIETAKQELIATGEYGNIKLKDITDEATRYIL